jgi:natural product biosynthesis luciferase-like monooxygenase protein
MSQKAMKRTKAMQFSLLYFSENGANSHTDKYRLLLESAKFADRNGFSALWIPERHFHPFGGLYPNPAVLSAALAMITERIELRAGSVVLPLQHPIRVAENWATVDSLSNGRVSLAFASGWHVNDFVLAPERYADRKTLLWDGIKQVKKLWAGEAIEVPGVDGNPVRVKTFPRPVQPELPVWVTCQSPETFIGAGEIGANVLTALLHETVDDVAKKISYYRESLSQHGFDPNSGRVALMLHTFLGDDLKTVYSQVKDPFCTYLRTNLNLLEHLIDRLNLNINLHQLSENDVDSLLQFGFSRYLDGRTLIGTPESCFPLIEKVKQIGVNEIACLIDFGCDVDAVMTSLSYLNRLINYCQAEPKIEQYTN